MIGVVILYYPELDKLLENINTYIHSLSTLLVYDNSESPNEKLEHALHAFSEKISYTYFGENEGIPKRLNQAVQFAKNTGADLLLTMDQDSSFKLGDFDKYLQIIHQNTWAGVAQFGINCQPHLTPLNPLPEQTTSLITSGSILNVACIESIGEFNEKLFIDFVDTEFSYKVTNAGFINLLCSNIVLNHSIGYFVEGRSLITLKKSKRIVHNPIRVYYIIRNGLYLLFKTKGLTPVQRKDILRSMYIVKNDFIYNPKLFYVYIYTFIALKDFLLNKMGKRY